jgi:2-oxoglutarate ferredoxin oxidoreductase subunit gamma
MVRPLVGQAQSQTYEPTSRRGYCNSDLVVADADVDYPLTTALDQLVLLDGMAAQSSWPLLKAATLVIADTRLCPQLPAGDARVHHLPLSRTAIDLGSERTTIEAALRANTPRSYLDLNLDALAAGYGLAAGVTALA